MPEIAEVLFQAYRHHRNEVEGRAGGVPIPPWSDLTDEQRARWIAVGRSVILSDADRVALAAARGAVAAALLSERALVGDVADGPIFSVRVVEMAQRAQARISQYERALVLLDRMIGGGP